MSRRRPAASASAVRCRSSGDGCRIARRVVVDEDHARPRRAGRRRGTARRPGPATTTRCPGRRSRPGGRRSWCRGARSAAPRARAGPSGGRAGRPRRAGRGSSSGRPASRPAAAGRARTRRPAGPRAPRRCPGTAASSSSVARARPVSPSCRASASVGEVDGRPPARPRAPHQPDQLGRRRGRPRRAARGVRAVARPPAARGSPAGARSRPVGSPSGWGHGSTSSSTGQARAAEPARWLAATDPARASPRSGRRKPADSSRHPDPRTRRSLATGAHRRLTRPFTGAPPGTLGSERPIGLGEDQQDPVERGVQAE